MKKYGLNKADKLCSTTAIETLFSRGSASKDYNICSSIAYPLRAVWRFNTERKTGSQIIFLISIPKKRLKHAVDRVKMRRRVREAYRLNRLNYIPSHNQNIDLAFIYIADDLKDYFTIKRSVCRILQKIQETIPSNDNEAPLNEKNSPQLPDYIA